MMRNILALQQNLKNIGDSPLEVNFVRSRKFWEVFGRGPSVRHHQKRRINLKLTCGQHRKWLNRFEQERYRMISKTINLCWTWCVVLINPPRTIQRLRRVPFHPQLLQETRADGCIMSIWSNYSRWMSRGINYHDTVLWAYLHLSRCCSGLTMCYGADSADRELLFYHLPLSLQYLSLALYPCIIA